MYSIVDLSGSQGGVNFGFAFDYLSEAHIHVYLDGVETEDFTFATEFTIALDTPLTAATTVRIRRITPIDEPQVNFANGSVLGESDLDTSVLQVLFAQQELSDFNDGNMILSLADSGEWDAESHRITNVTSPSQPTDAATKAYVDAQFAASPGAISITALQDVDPTAVIDAGSLVVGNTDGPSVLTTLPEGANLDILEVDTTQTTHLRWRSLVSKLFQLLTTKGDLLVSTGATTARLPVGSNDQVLVADSAQTGGVKWADPASLTTVVAAAYNDNAVMNPEMEIAQRGTSFVSPANNTTTLDRWKWAFSGAAVVTITQSSDVPTVVQAGKLFNYSLKVDLTTADAAIAAGDYACILQRIEGSIWRHFAQRALTLSFWVKSPKTGTHCIAITNSGLDRSFLAEYTVNVADTWEQKTVSITASPSAGTWDYTTGIGAELRFALAAGSTFHSTTGWTSTNAIGTANQVNCLDNTANNFFITGVKLEVGTQATPLQPIPFDVELQRCQRYFGKSFEYATAPAQAVGSDGVLRWPAVVAGANGNDSPFCPFKVRMRLLPTMTFYSPVGASALAYDQGVGAWATTTYVRGEYGFNVIGTGNAGTAEGNAQIVHWSADSEL